MSASGLHIYRDPDTLPESARGLVVALGNFEGLHRGHQAVIAETKRLAAEKGVAPAVMTFSPHPREYFSHPHAPLNIYPLAHKLRILAEEGIHHVYLMRFNKKLATLPAEAFVSLLSDQLNIAALVTGENFAFGKGRAGNTALLEQEAKKRGFHYVSIGGVTDANGEICSSSRIRLLLSEGNIPAANRLLGRPYSLGGRVIDGQKKGRELGFPTANLRLKHQYPPAFGVYAAHVRLPDDSTANAVINIGVRPTLRDDSAPLIEAHLLDRGGIDLYGKELTVLPQRYLREEQTFDSLEDLQKQIMHDCETARQVLQKADDNHA